MADAAQVSGVCAQCGASLSFPLGATQVQCEFCGGGMAVGQDVGLVRLDCPVCSGNFYYIDGSMAGQCPYCEAPLLALTHHRLLRFLIRPAAPRPAGADDAQLVLLPFWRLAGLIFGWDFGAKVEMVNDSPASVRDPYDGGRDGTSGVSRRDSGPMKSFRSRVLDRTLADPSTEAFGVRSLRLRAAVHPMEPFTAEHEGIATVVPATLEVPTARERLYSAAMRFGYAEDGMTTVDCQRADIVAEALSLLYYPFWARRVGEAMQVWDGVTGDPETLHDLAPRPVATTTTAFDELKVVEGRCGACGEPLTAGNRAVVWPCEACQTFWVAGPEGLQQFTASYARPLLDPGGAALSWLPFWQVASEVESVGKVARYAADVRTVLGVLGPRGEAPSAPPDSPLCFYVPAYGTMRAPRLDFAARDMTRLQPLLEPGAYAKGETFHCFFGPDDAERLGYVVMLNIIPGSVVRRAASLRVRPGRVALWYVPFADQGRELRNLLTGALYDRASFRGVGH